MIIKINQNTL